MKTGKLALLATLLSALTLGSLVPPAAAAEQPVQETVSPAAEAPGSEPAPAQETTPPQPAPVPESDPDTAPEATVLPSPEVSLPPVEAVPSESGESSGEAEDDGYEYVPVGEGHVVPGPDSPLITEADGSVRPAVETTEDHTSQARSVDGAASMLSAAARAGNIKVTLVRATVQGDRREVNLSAARNSVSSASSYWRAMSNNRLSMSIASEKVHYSASAHANDDYATMMNKIARELKWVDNPYTALVVFVPTADLKSGGYGGILGGGWTTGGTAGRILMPAPSSFTNNVVTHEVGHVLGLLHANSLQCTNGRSDVSRAANGRWSDAACSSREYGDTTDLMGSAQYNQPVINSYFWDVGKFGSGNEVLNAGRVSGSKTYTLRSWGGTGANRAVKFTDPVSGEVYYLELRQPAGYDQYLQWGPAGNRGVKIVKADAVNTWSVFSLIIPPSTRPFAGYYNTNHAWQAGQTFRTHTGSSVYINWINSTSASVTIKAGAAALAAGPIADLYAKYPQLGKPVGAIRTGVKDNGAYQDYERGAIVWSPGTGARVSMGAIRAAWGAAGFDGGYLGLPTSNEVYGLPNGGAYQDYQGGSIIYSPATGARVSKNGPIRNEWGYTGFDRSYLGYPTSNEIGGLPGGGIYQDYQHGAIIWSPATGARVSRNGPIRTLWGQTGFDRSPLGYPTANQVGLPGGGISQEYQRGTIIYSKSAGTWMLTGAVRNAWRADGAQKSSLGYPKGNEVRMGNQGTYQDFQGGAIIWSEATGAQISKNGAIRTAWGSTGFNSGYLRLPTGAETLMGNQGKYQDYEGGAIIWSAKTGAQISKNGPIRTAWGSTGFNSGYLRLPTGAEKPSVNQGLYQDYEGGTILWSQKTGAQITKNGPIRDAYRSAGAERGRLGYPTAAESVSGGTRTQNFEGGRISVGSSGKAVISYK